MAYATRQNLIDLLGEDEYLAVADRDGSGVADTEAVDQSLANAESMVDSYIARFLPLSEVPDVLVRHVMWIAVYDLAGNRQTEDQRRRYEDAVRWLKDVANGTASLGIPPNAADPVPGAILTSYPNTRALTRSTLRGLL